MLVDDRHQLLVKPSSIYLKCVIRHVFLLWKTRQFTLCWARPKNNLNVLRTLLLPSCLFEFCFVIQFDCICSVRLSGWFYFPHRIPFFCETENFSNNVWFVVCLWRIITININLFHVGLDYIEYVYLVHWIFISLFIDLNCLYF